MRGRSRSENGQIIKDIGPCGFQNNIVVLYKSVPG